MVLGLLISVCIIATLALAFSLYTFVELKAMQKSTHKIEYVGASPDNVSVSTDIGSINDKYKEELGETLPFFNNEETAKVRSF